LSELLKWAIGRAREVGSSFLTGTASVQPSRGR
jgi:hypothetical protein